MENCHVYIENCCFKIENCPFKIENCRVKIENRHVKIENCVSKLKICRVILFLFPKFYLCFNNFTISVLVQFSVYCLFTGHFILTVLEFQFFHILTCKNFFDWTLFYVNSIFSCLGDKFFCFSSSSSHSLFLFQILLVF